jgi:hypothetical protein
METPRSRLVAQVSLGSGGSTVSLTGRFTAVNRWDFREETASGSRFVHRLSVFVDQAPLPLEAVFLGQGPEKSKAFAAIVEHTLRLPNGQEHAWQAPQQVRPTSRKSEGITGADGNLVFDASATFLLRPSSGNDTTATTASSLAIESPDYLGIQLRTKALGRFEPASAMPEIIEVRLPTVLARGVINLSKVIVPKTPLTPESAGSYHFITTGVQGITPASTVSASSVPKISFLRRGSAAEFLTHGNLLAAVGLDPNAENDAVCKPVYKDGALTFKPKQSVDLAALSSIGGQQEGRYFDAATIIPMQPRLTPGTPLPRSTVVESAVTATLVPLEPDAIPKPVKLTKLPSQDVQFAAFIAGRLTRVAVERLPAIPLGSIQIDLADVADGELEAKVAETVHRSWGKGKLASLRSPQGGVVVADFRVVSAVPLTEESGARESEQGRQVSAPYHPIASQGLLDPRCIYPLEDLARTVPDRTAGLVLFGASPAPADGRGRAVAGIRYRLTPEWPGDDWRFSTEQLRTAWGTALAKAWLEPAPDTDPRTRVRKSVVPEDLMTNAMTKLKADTAAVSDLELIVRELNMLLQTTNDESLVESTGGGAPDDWARRFLQRRERLQKVFGVPETPELKPRLCINQIRPARAIPENGTTFLGLTHDEQTPFELDPWRTPVDVLRRIVGQRLRAVPPKTEFEREATVLPPMMDVVSWSARPGERGVDRWAVTPYQMDANASRIGQAAQAVAALRRPRARAGRDEKVQLTTEVTKAQDLLGSRFRYESFIVTQTLGALNLPKAQSNVSDRYKEVRLVVVDPAQFVADVEEVLLAPTFPAILRFEKVAGKKLVPNVALFLVARKTFLDWPAGSAPEVSFKLPGGGETVWKFPKYVTLLLFNKDKSVSEIAIKKPFDGIEVATFLTTPDPKPGPPVATESTLMSLDAAKAWTSLGDNGAFRRLPLEEGKDSARLLASIQSVGQPERHAIGVVTYELQVDVDAGNVATKPPKDWIWKKVETLPQAELFMNFIDKAGVIIAPKMTAALLVSPKNAGGVDEARTALGGYRLLDDKDFSPIEPRVSKENAEEIDWIRTTVLESLLRRPNTAAGAEPFDYDLVVTGSGGELIPSRPS